MKNNFLIKIFLSLIIYLIINTQYLLANSFDFTAKKIEVINDEIIKASEEIELITNEGVIVTADYLEFNLKKNLYKLENNILIKDTSKNLDIRSNKIFYDENLKLFKSEGFTKIDFDKNFFKKFKYNF